MSSARCKLAVKVDIPKSVDLWFADEIRAAPSDVWRGAYDTKPASPSLAWTISSRRVPPHKRLFATTVAASFFFSVAAQILFSVAHAHGACNCAGPRQPKGSSDAGTRARNSRQVTDASEDEDNSEEEEDEYSYSESNPYAVFLPVLAILFTRYRQPRRALCSTPFLLHLFISHVIWRAQCYTEKKND